MGGGSPPGRNARLDEFEECWPHAKSYGRRLDADGQRMTGLLLAAKSLVGQVQQQRTLADATKPRAAMKGGE